MKIRDILTRGFSLSFEVFPPVREGNLETLFAAIEELQVLKPNFISVTYGAGGGSKDKTVAIAARIKKNYPCEALAHLTCVGAATTDVAAVLSALAEEGIENVLALRGDPPKGENAFQPVAGGFRYASELISFIKTRGDFCVGVAGYPEGHPEAENLEADIRNLKKKVMAGADFVTTQMFFDNEVFLRFVDRARGAGITVPILPGIFPVLNYNQISKISSLSRATLPTTLAEKLDKLRDKPAETEKYGIDFAIRQADALMGFKVEGMHFYTMNKSAAAIRIVSELGLRR